MDNLVIRRRIMGRIKFEYHGARSNGVYGTYTATAIFKGEGDGEFKGKVISEDNRDLHRNYWFTVINGQIVDYQHIYEYQTSHTSTDSLIDI